MNKRACRGIIGFNPSGQVYYNLPTTREKKANAKAAAAKAGMTLQDFVNEAIMEKIGREEG